MSEKLNTTSTETTTSTESAATSPVVRPIDALRAIVNAPRVNNAAICRAYSVDETTLDKSNAARRVDAEASLPEERRATAADAIRADRARIISVDYVLGGDTINDDITRAIAAPLYRVLANKAKDADTVADALADSLNVLTSAGARVSRITIGNAPSGAYFTRNTQEVRESFTTWAYFAARDAADNGDIDAPSLYDTAALVDSCINVYRASEQERRAQEQNAQALNMLNVSAMSAEQRAALLAMLQEVQA